MNRSILSLWAIAVMITALLFIPEVFMHGMFFDGITYSSIARNLSEGLGSFWSPMYTLEFQNEFIGHPPLAIGIQSLVFTISGDVFFLEKLYSFFCLLAIFGMLTLIWKQFTDLSSAWLPIIFMMTFPITLWAFRNNLLENTMTIFTTSAVFFFVIAESKMKIINYILGSTFVFLAFLCKGPVGLFPLACPFIYQIVFKSSLEADYPRVILTLTSSLVMCFGLLFLIQPESIESLSRYMNIQVYPSLMDEGEITASSRFSILVDLTMQMLPSLAILFLILILSKSKIKSLASKRALFYLLLGLSASIPLIITLKQRNFYLIPSIPFYALAIAKFIEPIFLSKITLIKRRLSTVLIATSTVGIAVALSLSVVNFGKYSRDDLLIKDVQSLTDHLPPRSTIGSSDQNCYDWTLLAYLMRYGQLSISCYDNTEYFLERKTSTSQSDEGAIDLNNFILKRNNKDISE